MSSYSINSGFTTKLVIDDNCIPPWKPNKLGNGILVKVRPPITGTLVVADSAGNAYVQSLHGDEFVARQCRPAHYISIHASEACAIEATGMEFEEI